MFVQDIALRLFEEFRDQTGEKVDVANDDYLFKLLHFASLPGGAGLIAWYDDADQIYLHTYLAVVPLKQSKTITESMHDTHLHGADHEVIKVVCGPITLDPEEWGPQTPKDKLRVFLGDHGVLDVSNPLSELALRVASRAVQLWNSSEVEKRTYPEVR